jgi:hypothetical protein
VAYPSVFEGWATLLFSYDARNWQKTAGGPGHPPKKFLGCANRQSSLEEQLSALVVVHGNLLVAGVKITSYN